MAEHLSAVQAAWNDLTNHYTPTEVAAHVSLCTKLKGQLISVAGGMVAIQFDTPDAPHGSGLAALIDGVDGDSYWAVTFETGTDDGQRDWVTVRNSGLAESFHDSARTAADLPLR